MYSRNRATSRSVNVRSDKILVFLVLLLVFFGLVMIANVSAPQALSEFGDRFFFAKQQVLWALLGLISTIIFARVNYRFWYQVAAPLFLLTISLLVLTLIPGIGVKFLGARRWLSLGFILFQPSELAKLSIIIFESKLLSDKNFKILPFFASILAASFLVIMQPDFGTAAIIVGCVFILFLISGRNLFYILSFGLISVLLAIILIMSVPYRRQRLLNFLQPSDPLGSGYHINQILLAIGTGKLFGVGLGQSRQKYLFLPETSTDSIFAVIAEELGFVGSTILVSVYLLLIFRILKIASHAPDNFSALLCCGIASWIAIQSLLNLAGMVTLIPLTGVPLPLISYGGSSLFMILLSLGIVLNISSQREVRQ